MILYRNGKSVITYESLYSNQKILIAIDSSKTNTAILVGNEYKEILDDFEIDGGGSDVDVYELCWDMRKALDSLFSGAKIMVVGIEDIITKKREDDKYKGMDIHQSRIKITAVFNNIIYFFQDRHNIMPRLINNKEWKAYTLPEEYRKLTHKKGSKDYFKDIGSKWGRRSDDVTDAVCIFSYLCEISKIKVIHKIDNIIKSENKFSYSIFPLSIKNNLPLHSKEFTFNDKYTVIQNIETVASNLSSKDVFGFFKISINKLPLDCIYSKSLVGSYNKGVDELVIVVEIKK